MMVLRYCEDGNLRNYYLNKELGYGSKCDRLKQIARGLLDIHNAGKVHKDFHSGNILYNDNCPYISDLGMCQPANNDQMKKKEIMEYYLIWHQKFYEDINIQKHQIFIHLE
jgi:serine/threonine protein kinase